MISPKIKNLIFDLGGVIINIDPNRTVTRFAELAGLSAESADEVFKNLNVFHRYEIGDLSDEEFVLLMQEACKDELDEAQVHEAWNHMLLDIPTARITLLKQLRNSYGTFLLSNTNQVHINEVENILYDSAGVRHLDEIFDKVYYSHKMGMRKPDLQIFEKVLDEQRLKAEETLFIDDTLANLEAADKLGLHTIQCTPQQDLLTIFSDVADKT